MNNERRGVNCAHTWFLKQEEIKSQFSQWVFSPQKVFLWQWKSSSPSSNQKNPPHFSCWTSFFLSSSEKYLFRKKISFSEKQISSSEKQISFLEKKNIFSRKTNIFLFFVSVLPFLCPSHDLCCSHLFSLICAPWRPMGPPSKKFLHVSKSYCSFKKRGWFLTATKDVTRGPLG